MSDRLATFSKSLRERTQLMRLGPAPALLVLPEGPGPFPLLLWLHGRTVSKEIDSARYLRLLRAGVATCAIDLPGHGEREDLTLQAPSSLPDLIAEGVDEIDSVLEALRDTPQGAQVQWNALGMGGMSAGGMITLRRLCDPHGFRCAVVESTSGDLKAASGGKAHDRLLVAALKGLDPVQHLERWAPIPFLALHSEKDEVTPLVGMTSFVEALDAHYRGRGAEGVPRTLKTWPSTGAPREHAGFGKKAGEARALLVEFLGAHLVP